MDIILYLALLLGFFAATAGFVYLLDRLGVKS